MKKSAFTLIELLVTIVIIGVLAAVSVAQYKDFTKKAETAKTINALVEYQDLFERYYTENGVYPEPSATETWFCLADYGSVDRCYAYSFSGSVSELFGDNQLRQTLLAEAGVEFDTPSYTIGDLVSESLLYRAPLGGQGYAMLFYVDIPNFDCTRLRGLNDHVTGTLTYTRKNSWTDVSPDGGSSSCLYAIEKGKPIDYYDLWN